MGKPTKHHQTIALDHCWVCNERFNDVVNPGSASREEHHVIPVRAGGKDGPTVSLCASHHSCLHAMAEFMSAKRQHAAILLIRQEPEDRKRKLMWLATRVVNAFAAMSNDPNKLTLCSVEVNKRQIEMIEQLKKVTGFRSREAVLLACLEQTYSRHFSLRK
ncbi:homing endonuclease [Burkholderia phage BCSR5]|nr:homing endonuclease [Burkholderia phage BCSR5]